MMNKYLFITKTTALTLSIVISDFSANASVTLLQAILNASCTLRRGQWCILTVATSTCQPVSLQIKWNLSESGLIVAQLWASLWFLPFHKQHNNWAETKLAENRSTNFRTCLKSILLLNYSHKTACLWVSFLHRFTFVFMTCTHEQNSNPAIHVLFYNYGISA